MLERLETELFRGLRIKVEELQEVVITHRHSDRYSHTPEALKILKAAEEGLKQAWRAFAGSPYGESR